MWSYCLLICVFFIYFTHWSPSASIVDLKNAVLRDSQCLFWMATKIKFQKRMNEREIEQYLKYWLEKWMDLAGVFFWFIFQRQCNPIKKCASCSFALPYWQKSFRHSYDGRRKKSKISKELRMYIYILLFCFCQHKLSWTSSEAKKFWNPLNSIQNWKIFRNLPVLPQLWDLIKLRNRKVVRL